MTCADRSGERTSLSIGDFAHHNENEVNKRPNSQTPERQKLGNSETLVTQVEAVNT